MPSSSAKKSLNLSEWLLAVSTFLLALATYQLWRSTEKIAYIEQEHSRDEWMQQATLALTRANEDLNGLPTVTSCEQLILDSTPDVAKAAKEAVLHGESRPATSLLEAVADDKWPNVVAEPDSGAFEGCVSGLVLANLNTDLSKINIKVKLSYATNVVANYLNTLTVWLTIVNKLPDEEIFYAYKRSFNYTLSNTDAKFIESIVNFRRSEKMAQDPSKNLDVAKVAESEFQVCRPIVYKGRKKYFLDCVNGKTLNIEDGN